jgi:translation initiation factor 2B subunit (eIF-2B alpha/beta/delta family)
MLFNGMKYASFILRKVEKALEGGKSGKGKAKSLEELKMKVANAFMYFLDLVKHGDKYVYIHGSSLIKDKMNILTHCHASSVIKLFKSAVW